MRAKPDMKPWVHTEEKDEELRRSGTHSERLVCVVAIRGLAFGEKVPPLWGSKKCGNNYPRACALGYAGVSPLPGSSTSSLSFYYFDTVALNK